MDEDAFRSFFAAHFDDEWRFARRRCDSSEDADDVTAESFAVLWRRRRDLPPEEERRLWLFGVVRRVLANQRRANRRRAGLDERLKAVVMPRSTTTDDPAELAVAHDESRVGTALASLSEDQRDLFVMRAWDELSVTDMATLLGCTPNAVSVRLHKARRRLAQALTDTAGTDPRPPRTSPDRTLRSEGERT